MPTPRPSRGAIAAALLLLALGLAARLRLLAAGHSYWYDEAYLLLNVFARSGAALLGPLDMQQAAPPLYLWALRGLYDWLGPAEWAMRLPAFAAGVAALLLMAPLGRRLAGEPGWLWAVGLCALSGHAVTHGCEVKPYAVDLLVAEAVLLAAAVALTAEPGRRRAALAALAGL